MAPPVKIRLASRAYDGIVPILRGQMGIPGFDLDIIETEDVPAMFAGIALRKDLAKRHPELPEELFWPFLGVKGLGAAVAPCNSKPG